MTISLLLSGLFANDGGAPLPGLAVGWSITEHITAEARFSSLLLVNLPDLGAKGYLFKSNFSPYFYARAGVAHVASVFEVKTSVFFAGYVGAGIEYAADNGFNIGLESGPIFLAQADFRVLGSVVLNLGFRF